MTQSLRMMIFIILFLTSSKLFAQPVFPKCISAPHGHYLLTSFYYTDDVILHSATLNHYTAAVKHLDALLYSASYLGIIKDNGDFKLAKITKQNCDPPLDAGKENSHEIDTITGSLES
ncbi:hypothetical protein [Coxiella burnetii]|uniref:hypothetical protein n=2 Tax=Coxiella burnetii TaxID=777 RepID=UPI0000ED02EB|nr:hypothetical protein [Coxiella burnetii]APQ67042.1 hypothetical protein A35_05015 [Coxiella burnetii 'MSU Goat Q177']UYK68930.1 hypothetical protein OHM78_05690 [Coxiella burnetii]